MRRFELIRLKSKPTKKSGSLLSQHVRHEVHNVTPIIPMNNEWFFRETMMQGIVPFQAFDERDRECVMTDFRSRCHVRTH